MFLMSLLGISFLAMFAPVLTADSPFEGTWEAIEGEEKGLRLTKEDFEGEPCVFVFRKNELSVTWGREKETYTIRYDPRAAPHTIDLIFPNGKGTNHAIYALEDGKLTVCFSRKMNPNSPDERPVRFTTDRGQNKQLTGLILLVFRKSEHSQSGPGRGFNELRRLLAGPGMGW